MKICIVTLALLAAAPAYADEWSDGWCAGYADARMAMNQNRDHWRALLHQPKETSRETLDRIYSQAWIGPLSPRRLDQPEGAPKEGPSVIDSVDLYVMLAPIDPGTKVALKDRVIICPAAQP